MNRMPHLSLILVTLLATACRNDAITFAKLVDSRAECNSVNTTIDHNGGEPDVAICRVGREVQLCKAGGHVDPTCVKIRDIVAEDPAPASSGSAK